MEDNNRSKAKDAIAFGLLYGGTTVAQAGLLLAAVAAGFISKSGSRGISRLMSKASSFQKNKAWNTYKETGKISDMINTFFENQ